VMQFHGCLVSRRPLSTADVHVAPLRDKTEDEKEMKVFKCQASQWNAKSVSAALAASSGRLATLSPD
jgi:hypothetical protein